MNVVDFRENALPLPAMAQRLGRNPVTLRRWCKSGLEHCKLGGTVYITLEALNRFQRKCESPPTVQAVIVDQETLAALKQLRSRGIVFGQEANRDGSAKAKAG